ncbi:MAG: glycosyltransferase family 2 protein [Betaproteobacteria bacterium HGW-Betaproteobacteria-4]|jgi:glycosyltransferase involved in cell wall biosynthesis|nr:MAG: glycosyltransferase family 2 protein [Betaproteobacteria bacterium HGW-Betaproteobacteria-4]
MKYRLSICIPTLNRGYYIGETLESIVSQWEDGVEVVIVDGGSTDNTEEVVNSYQKRFPDIRYVKKDSSGMKPSNEGFDRDCDQSVVLADGEYCWLMTDDDLLKPGALRKILSSVESDYAVVVANAEVMNSDFTELLVSKRPAILRDRIFERSEWSEFACTVGSHLTFVGAVIIKRHLWLSRNREKYYGSGFIHVGVIFDEPIAGRMLVTADPLVSIRFGNAQWTSRAFQIWMINWPSLIWSFASLPDTAKLGICPREPWRNLTTLLFNRALGMYSWREYQLFIDGHPASSAKKLLSRLIAMVPRVVLYIPARIYIRTMLSDSTYVLFNLKESWKKK